MMGWWVEGGMEADVVTGSSCTAAVVEWGGGGELWVVEAWGQVSPFRRSRRASLTARDSLSGEIAWNW